MGSGSLAAHSDFVMQVVKEEGSVPSRAIVMMTTSVSPIQSKRSVKDTQAMSLSGVGNEPPCSGLCMSPDRKRWTNTSTTPVQSNIARGGWAEEVCAKGADTGE
jgi:hypothetical protein